MTNPCDKCTAVSACQECCEHEWDFEEGGMCLSCGREDYYNSQDEDYGREDR